MIKAVLFDLDGTLLDTESLSDKAILFALGKDLLPNGAWETAVASGYRIPWELKKQLLGLRGSEWAPKVIKYCQTVWGIDNPPTVETLWNGWEENLSKYCEEVEACVGARELVRQLAHAGVPMAIATSSRYASVEKKRKRHEDTIFRHMSAIVAGDHPAVKNGKPAPDIYIEAARQLGIDPSDCLVFEDALSGVRSGKAAGCRVVGVPDPRFDESERAAFYDEADIVLHDLTHFDGKSYGLKVKLSPISSGTTI